MTKVQQARTFIDLFLLAQGGTMRGKKRPTALGRIKSALWRIRQRKAH